MIVEAWMGNKALGFTMDQENTIWEMWRRGDSLSATGRVLGESVPSDRPVPA